MLKIKTLQHIRLEQKTDAWNIGVEKKKKV